jgi:hypothetical protein
MRIDDEKIIESYNLAVEAGHPDPEGFIARAEIKTGLDYDGEYKGAVGAFGVNKQQALEAGFTEEELETTDGNLAAAIAVDMQNLRKANGDLDEMYRLGNSGSSKSTERFIVKLSKERENLTNKFVFENGKLVSFRQAVREGDTTDSFSLKASEDKLVYKETRRIKTPDDIKKQTNTFEFRQADKQKIDDLMVRLVHTIIDEKPINAL